MDLLIEATHVNDWDDTKIRESSISATVASTARGVCYSDTRKDEQERLISIKSTPHSVLLPDLKGKHYLLNLVDTPGHVDFRDEAIVGLAASDGAVLVVDVVEGVLMNTELLIQSLVRNNNTSVVLCLAKMDRLVLDLKLPVRDAYAKIQDVIKQVNHVFRRLGSEQVFSPRHSNVVFASGLHGWCFTLEVSGLVVIGLYRHGDFFLLFHS